MLDNSKRQKSCGNRSSSNLKTHLERVHKWSEEKMKSTFDVRVVPATSRKRKLNSTGKGSIDAGPSTSDDFFQPKKKFTQDTLNQAVDEFVVCTRQSHRIVDHPKSRNLVLLDRPSHIKVVSRQTQ
ncbi:2-oxoisovalerate dehydrogenase subunit alpha [Frankliniella fusca]|uniref:2-oxoisovalerate dehydrogenase subunit alpha n=1 Tax=Frankliniella fusca TaxID=407009 RepID=A0AAE1HNH4_9NEOP|nr:2-oxoisovalerate dehydrogenase subunit alpha [Frankliniella fusca]